MLVFLLLLRELFSETDWKKQLSIALLLIPVIMRLFLIK